MSEQERANARSGEKKQERSWLTTYLLMMLRSWNAYGYELVRQLAFFGFGAIDPANVYRALRDLERDGYVTSQWDTSVTSGPARRVYTITEAGLEALNLWSSALDNYRQSLDRFFNLYQGGMPMPQATPATPAQQPAAEQPQVAADQPETGTTETKADSARR
jgi:PadR family transcriptional regulator, regulatory protein PadR